MDKTVSHSSGSRTVGNLELDDKSIKQAVFDDRVLQFMARERNVSLSGPFASAYLAFLHVGAIELHVLLAWWLALFLCDATTFVSTVLYLRKPKTTRSRRWLGRVFFAQSLAGVVWGLSVYLFRVPGELKYELYTFVILVAVGSVTSVALLPFRTAFIGFLLGIWTFPFFYLLSLGEVFYINFAIGVAVMVSTMVSYQVISTRQFVDGIEQKLRASMLADKLDSALKKLERLAIYDELTGIYNRRFGLDCLQKEKRMQVRDNYPLSIVILDIDLFKSINDKYGHGVGDEVLVRFSACVRAQLRDGVTFFRYGGEEFLLVLPHTSLAQAAVATERLRAAINDARLDTESAEHKVTASFGVAETPIDESIERAIERADHALYEAKRNGRDRVELALPIQAS